MTDSGQGMGRNISEEIVDYILRVTREIWEDRNPELVMRYYAPETRVHALGGIMRGAAEVTENTRAMQAAFPDRLVIGEDVVCSPLEDGAWLSSHRIRSPMTSKGENAYGPATGRKVTTYVFRRLRCQGWNDHEGVAGAGQPEPGEATGPGSAGSGPA